jgi:hypothetical protein
MCGESFVEAVLKAIEAEMEKDPNSREASGLQRAHEIITKLAAA